MMNPGERYGIKRIGGDDKTRRRLEDLGFVVGGEVAIVSATPDGNLIVNILGTRIALNSDLARRIFV